MTIDEALENIDEILSSDTSDTCEKCKAQHEQLGEWLRELKDLREYKKGYVRHIS